MSRKVFCQKYQAELEGLERAPFPGPKGEWVFEHVSRQAWQEWLKHQTLLINETNATLRIQKLRILYGLARSMLSGVFNIVLLWMGATQILAGQLSVGMLMAFLAYRSQFDSRVTGLIDQFIDLKMLRLYGERLADVVLTPGEEEIRRTLTETPGVCNVHDVRTRKMGDMIVVDVHIEVDSTLSVEAGHDIAVEARARVMQRHRVLNLMTHVDPWHCLDRDHDHIPPAVPH